MREIALDTETTGLDPKSGHRIVEIGCVEMVRHISTGRTFQAYINPERDMPEEAFRVHGLSQEFLQDKPKFAAIAQDFLDFIGDANLVIHNAAFDMGFLNAELARAGHDTIHLSRAIDTVDIARQKFPGSPVNLDALCKRFQIDLTGRELHGALKDSELLARVYLELVGGREPGLVLAADGDGRGRRKSGAAAERTFRPARPHAVPDAERAAHEAFLKKISDPLWSA